MKRPLAAAAAGLISITTALADPTYKILEWDDLREWEGDDHDAALSVFVSTCKDLNGPEWQLTCEAAKERVNQKGTGRAFFETFFRPVLVGDGRTALFTGYYEPELEGSRSRSGPFQWPIYRKPPEVRRGTKWHTRAEIEERGLLQGRGLEIAWLADPVDAFFLQVQGSGRIRLTDGEAIRVGFGGRNGHDYRSVGRELVRRGLFQSHQVSAATIRNWVRRNPEKGAKLLHVNPSFIFFRELEDLPATAGPLGAMNRSVTPMRTIAVDPDYNPLGAPVWIEKDGETPLNRLMVAQDTGSAIKGAQRADVFVGTGEAAGKRAGVLRDPGRMIVLFPIDTALALVQGN